MTGNWTDYFSRIYLITTINRHDRTMEAEAELNKYKIPFTLIYGRQERDGNIGLYKTMKQIFKAAIGANLKNILVFENDILFTQDPNQYMPLCVDQLDQIKDGWHIFHLGPNTHKKFTSFVSPNILPLQKGRSTHAVAYSREGMRQIVENLTKYNFVRSEQHIDIYLERFIQPKGKSYCSYPFLATQRDGYSDISLKNVSNDYIAERYYENLKEIEK